MEVAVLIVGAGPTGLMLAEELARFGIDFRIVDSGRGPTDLSKAVGVQARTLETLDIIGVADELARRGNPAKAFHIYDGDKNIANLDFTQLDSRFPYLLIVPQSDTEHVLLERLEAGKRVERSTTVTAFTQDEAGVDATLQRSDGATENVRARWLVGCDGAHSAVRQGLGLPFEGEDYAEGFMLADVRVEWSLPKDELYLFLHDGWLSAFFALPGDRCRLIADLPPEQAPPGKTPTLEECQRVVRERVPFPVTLSDPVWTAYYRIHRRIVPRLQESRVFLAGDAAHIHSPAAAQGMNTGIQDAFNLGWKLALAARGQASDRLLESYNAERYPVERGVLKGADLLLNLATLRPPALRKLRDLLMPLVSGTKAFQERMSTTIGELAIDYHDSPIVLDRDHASRLRAGRRAPDGQVTRSNGERVRLYELLRTGKFVLLAFAEPDEPAGGAFFGQIGAALTPVRSLIDCCVVTRKDAKLAGIPADWTWLHNSDGGVYAAYGVKHACVRVIRPDGYIGFGSNMRELEVGFSDYIQRQFGKAH